MTKPSNGGGGGRWLAQLQRALSTRAGGKLRKGARDSPEPEKALFVLLGPFQNRKLTQNLTCDLLTPHLKFNSTILLLFSQSVLLSLD